MAGQSHKGCDFIAKKPFKRCEKVGDDGTLAYESCPVACGLCGCQDSTTWTYKGTTPR